MQEVSWVNVGQALRWEVSYTRLHKDFTTLSARPLLRNMIPTKCDLFDEIQSLWRGQAQADQKHNIQLNLVTRGPTK